MKKPFQRPAFTILEVLIALTASLLLMLGLARAYKLLGDKITSRQSELDLSSRLRDVALRLRDELQRATCEMTPPASAGAGEGYLVYHEGPFTDKTTTLGSVPHPVPPRNDYFPDSRVGDIDDYLAFTTRAKEGAPFIGFIPRGVIDAHRFYNNQMTVAEQGAYDLAPGATSTQLIPFYSEVAEIAYWVSPEWVRNADGTLVYDTQVPDGGGEFTLHPLYEDRNDDLLPDKMNLHRRVLLVRPDLNLTTAQMLVRNGEAVNPNNPLLTIPTIPFLIRDSGGNLRIRPIADDVGINQAVFPGAAMQAPGLWRDPAATSRQLTAAPHWLAGIARLQQVMDLSISRVTNTWDQPSPDMTVNGTFGMPTSIVEANSLSSLTRPEKRFAHVRIPHEIISNSPGSSMPQLALCPPHPYLIARESSPPVLTDSTSILTNIQSTPTTFPHQADAVAGSAPGGTPYLNRYGRFTMKTFVRPEFNLADRVSDRGAGVLPGSVMTTNRGGSDVVATDVVGFDVQLFDPTAPTFVWLGEDGAAGTLNEDDDLDGLTDLDPLAGTDPNRPDLSEVGWPETDDEVVTVNDARMDEVLVDNGSREVNDWFPAGNQIRFLRVSQGDFVDLGYMHLAGGPARGLDQWDESGNPLAVFNNSRAAAVPDHLHSLLGPRSGLSHPDVNDPISRTLSTPLPLGDPNHFLESTFPVSWEQSGRFVIRHTTGHPSVSSFYQPVYDTWTDSYATDPFDQEGAGIGLGFADDYAVEVAGLTPGIREYTESRTSQATPANSPPAAATRPRTVAVRRWTSVSPNLVNPGEFEDQNAGQAQIPAQTADTPIALTPPVPAPLRAIKISIRVDDHAAETIRQQTVIQDF